MARHWFAIIFAGCIGLLTAGPARGENEQIPQSGLVLWLDAADLDGDGAPDPDRLADTLVGDDAARTAWVDKHGREQRFAQTDAAQRPRLIENAWGNHSAVRFDGKSALDLATFNGFAAGDQKLTLFIVFRGDTGAASQSRLIDFQGKAAPSAEEAKKEPPKANGIWIGRHDGDKTRLGIANGAEGEAKSSSWDGKPHLIEAAYSGNQVWSHRFHGVPDGGGTFAGSVFQGFPNEGIAVCLGRRANGADDSTGFTGDLAEVILYQRTLNEAERHQVGYYLERKYGLETVYGPPPNFESDVQPLLARSCHQCHGEDLQEKELDLRTVTAMLKGGENGPAIVRGYSDESLIAEMLIKGEMPPKKADKLSPTETALILHWIDLGAPAQEKVELPPVQSTVSADDRNFWSFRKPVRPPVPSVKNSGRVNSPIDSFVLAKLEEKGLTYSAEAERAVLVRRLYFDLIGLPPSPEEMHEYLADARSNAYELLVDRLLASPRFGERWGRHWLDVAGYVDTVSADNDAALIFVAAGKWRYRDYVIRSFNDDKPFDRFIIEQLAGDELVEWRNAETYTAEVLKSLVATGYLRNVADRTPEDELNTKDIRISVLYDTQELIGTGLLGLTMQCARCHSHKYEPIPQVDYYRTMALFTPAYNVDEWIQPYYRQGTKKKQRYRELPDVSAAEAKNIDEHRAATEKQIEPLQKSLDELRNKYRGKLYEQKVAAIHDAIRADTKAAVETPAEKRNAVQKYLAEKFGPALKVSADEITAALGDEDRKTNDSLGAQIASLKGTIRTYGAIQAMYDTGPPPVTRVFKRGNYLTPVGRVDPGFLSVLDDPEHPSSLAATGGNAPTSGRRLAYAKWLTNPDLPSGGLLSRVMVNRIWSHLFGQGIVKSTGNFGRSGALPTHPELLDWLATEFVARGWHVKPMIKLMVLSNAYRQASYVDSASANATSAEKVDPANDFLWHMRLRRLESEVVRDSVLAASGKLDLTVGGPSIALDPLPDGMVIIDKKSLPTPTSPFRRSVYLLARRTYNLSLLDVFDQPVINTNCTERQATSVVLQSLMMQNDSFILELADHFAARVRQGGPDATEKQIDLAFRIALARPPSAKEITWSTALLQRQTARHQSDAEGSAKTPEQAAQRALANLCHTLLNTSEFLYIE